MNENGEIIESLLNLIDVADCTVVGLVTSIDEIFCEHGLLIASLHGQGYDGCATTAGRYNGVQNLIKKQKPAAYFVLCYAHRLNLVIADTCKRNVITCIGVTYSEPRQRKVPTRMDDNEHVPIALTGMDRMK